ncbi:hypothetical protein D9M68_912620 [compost metagenome]
MLLPGRPQGIRLGAVKSFDGDDLLSLHLAHLVLARQQHLAVDMHRAGAAHAHAAPELGARELELAAKHPQQRRASVRADFHALTVDTDLTV